MFSVYFLLFFLHLDIYQVSGNTTSVSDDTDESMSYLDIDVNTKDKLHFPWYPDVSQNCRPRPIDCEEILRSGRNKSGVYTIWPRNRILEDRSIYVYCDMSTDGGGWTVIQRRGNFKRPIDYFFKTWSNYKAGFGDIEKDFWLGNDNIYALTNQRLYSIRFQLKAVDGEKRYAFYDHFWIEDESNKYRLRIEDYSGDAGDSMHERHSNQYFSTKDQDNDSSKDHCAQKYKGGWWYGKCHFSNLNGIYRKGVFQGTADGVTWNTFRGQFEALDVTEMKIRPKKFHKTLVPMDTPCSEG